jgi:hypothetical protein
MATTTSGPKIYEEIATNKGGKYNAIVAAAFAGQKPKGSAVAAIYGRFRERQPKGKEFMVALASATDEEVSGHKACGSLHAASPPRCR